jgi:hypothetical protein
LKRADLARGGIRTEYGGAAQNCRSLAQDIAIVWSPKNHRIAKPGDFYGLSDGGVPRRLLFPASPAFSADGHWVNT